LVKYKDKFAKFPGKKADFFKKKRFLSKKAGKLKKNVKK